MLQSSHPAHCHLPQNQVLVRTSVRYRVISKTLDSGIYLCCLNLSLTSAAVGLTWSPASSCPFSRCCLVAGLGRGKKKKKRKKERRGECWHHHQGNSEGLCNKEPNTNIPQGKHVLDCIGQPQQSTGMVVTAGIAEITLCKHMGRVSDLRQNFPVAHFQW